MSDQVIQCLHCSVYVLPRQDGTCPCCQANAQQEPTESDFLKIQARDIQASKRFAHAEGSRCLSRGALWLVGGLIVTGVTYAMAANNPSGGRYVLAYGAIFYGTTQIAIGLEKIRASRQMTDIERSILDSNQDEDSDRFAA